MSKTILEKHNQKQSNGIFSKYCVFGHEPHGINNSNGWRHTYKCNRKAINDEQFCEEHQKMYKEIRAEQTDNYFTKITCKCRKCGKIITIKKDNFFLDGHSLDMGVHLEVYHNIFQKSEDEQDEE